MRERFLKQATFNLRPEIRVKKWIRGGWLGCSAGAWQRWLRLRTREGDSEVREEQGKSLQGLMEFSLSACWYLILSKFPNISSVKWGAEPTRPGCSKEEEMLWKK